MELLIVRHAVAHERSARRWRNDDLRPLTAEGVRKFTKAARGLERLDVRPDRVLTSSLTRALQTARILTSIAGWPEATQTDALRPDTGPRALMVELRRYALKRIAVIGHDPSLSRLISACISTGGAQVELKKGGAALVTFDGKPREGRGELKWLVAPRVLRGLAGR